MANIEYLTIAFVHIPEPPSASRWLRMKGPRIESVNLAAPPITEAEIWEKRHNNPFLLDLLVEIKENEYKEGWTLFSMETPYFAIMDLAGNGTVVPHYRSVMVFSRWARNEA